MGGKAIVTNFTFLESLMVLTLKFINLEYKLEELA